MKEFALIYAMLFMTITSFAQNGNVEYEFIDGVDLTQKSNFEINKLPGKLLHAYEGGAISAYFPGDTSLTISYYNFVEMYMGFVNQSSNVGELYTEFKVQSFESGFSHYFEIYGKIDKCDGEVTRSITMVQLKFLDEEKKRIYAGPIFKMKDIKVLTEESDLMITELGKTMKLSNVLMDSNLYNSFDVNGYLYSHNSP